MMPRLPMALAGRVKPGPLLGMNQPSYVLLHTENREYEEEIDRYISRVGIFRKIA
jgi:hypothetical protein